MFDDPYEIEGPSGTRLTVRSAATRALILEVRLPAAATAPWFSALAAYAKRFDVLRGAVLVDGNLMHTGERMSVPRGREFILRAALAEDAHFVCDLQPAGDRAALIAGLEAALSRS